MKAKLPSCLPEETLSLKLMPTEQCNVRCMTCYEDSSVGRMSKKVIQGIKKLITSRLPEIKYLSIEWLGGEPLMAQDIIYDISDHILSVMNNLNVQYVSGMRTDGLQLKADTFKQLLSKEIRSYQISLDASTGKHIQTKHKIDGYGSFGQIWHNLLSMKKVDDDFKIMIGIPVTYGNYSTLRELCEHIKKEFYDDQRFSISIKVIKNHEVENTETLTNRFQEINKLIGVDQSDSSCHKSPNNIVIRADGTITDGFELSESRNSLAKITLDGKIMIHQERK